MPVCVNKQGRERAYPTGGLMPVYFLYDLYFKKNIMIYTDCEFITNVCLLTFITFYFNSIDDKAINS